MTESHSRFSGQNVAIVLSLCLGSISYGYDFSIITSTLGQPAFYTSMKLTTDKTDSALYAFTNNIIGALFGLFSAGAICGAVFVGWLCDAKGRKVSLVLAALINIVGAAVQTGSIHIGMFLAARFITGFAAAMFVTLVPIYIAEVAPPATRGLLVGQHGAFLLCGYSMAAWVSVGSYFAANADFQWRFPISLQALWPFLLLLFVRNMPESPRWLISQGRSEEAWDVLGRLHYDPKDAYQSFAREEFFQITTQLAADHAKYENVTILDLFRKPHFRKRMIAAAVVMFTSQAGGNLVIYGNIAILYKGLGFTDSVSLVLSASYITWACVCNFVNAAFIDRVGRVRSMLIGFSGGAVFVSIEAAIVSKYGASDNKAALGAGVAILFLYLTTFAGFCDTTLYVYCSEVFPTHIRAKGMAWSISVFMLATIPFLESSTVAFSTIGWKYYMLFIALAIVMVPLMYLYCPETKGLSLEEINGIFGDEVAVQLTHLTPEERARLDERIAHAPSKEKEFINVDVKAVKKSIPSV